MKPRVLFGALFHETHTFLPQPTVWSDFEICRGSDLLAKEHDESPTAGFLTSARRYGWEVVPTLGATALPSGPVADEMFERFWTEFSDRARPALAAGVEAIFLVLHGAMATKSVEDVEGELLVRLRALSGAANLPIFGVLDLHANVSRRMCCLANGLVMYRQNPHTDGKQTAERAAALLERCLRTGQVPRMSWCRVPVLWAPPGTGTQSDPMRALTALAARTEAADSTVWAYNVAAGFSFADTEESGLTLSVVSSGPADAARRHLQTGADLGWKLRELGVINYPGVEEVLDQIQPEPARSEIALHHPAGPILLVEPADNIGAGAPGDGTGILRALVARHVANALVAINDPAAVVTLGAAAIGSRVRLGLGGRGWSLDEGPLECEVTLVSRGSGAFQLEDPQSHLASMSGTSYDMGPCAVVRTGGVTILLTSVKTPPFDLGQYRSQGIHPEQFSVIGVKAAVAHRRAYDPIARASYYVDTPGPCSSNLTRFPYRRLRRPVYPLDPIATPILTFA